MRLQEAARAAARANWRVASTPHPRTVVDHVVELALAQLRREDGLHLAHAEAPPRSQSAESCRRKRIDFGLQAGAPGAAVRPGPVGPPNVVELP